VLTVLTFTLVLAGSGAGAAPVELVRSADDGIVFRVRADQYHLDARQAGVVRIEAPGFPLGSPPDRPWLPWRKVFVAVPPGVDVRVVARVDDVEVRSAPRVWEARAVSPDTISPPPWQPPSRWAELLELGYVRDQRVAVCAVHPFLHDSATAVLRIAPEIEVRLDFSGTPRGVVRDGGHFEKVYKDIILNYGSSRGWRRSGPAAGGTPWAPPFPSRKLYVNTEGLYRLSYENLAPHAPVGSINPHRFALWRDGDMVPLFVSGQGDPSDTTFDPREYIEFYGTFEPVDDLEGRLVPVPGDFTDEAVYWLCWQEQSPLRMVDLDATPDGAPDALNFTWVAHAESNTYAHRSGHGSADPNEWYWGGFFYPSEERQFTVEVTNPAPEPQAVLRVRFIGYSYGSHAADIEINGNPVSTAYWQGGVPYIWESDVAGVGWIPIQQGMNVVSITADDGYFFVDWIEIVYRRTYDFVDGALLFRGPAGEPGGVYRFTLRGAGGDTAEVINVGTGERLTGIQGGETAVFETAAAETSYFAAAWGEGFLGVEDLTRIEEEIPRDPLLGDSLAMACDYVIISHGDFIDAASDLKSFWETQRPELSVEVVDVQDVYDEFSYGVFHPLAIRDMLSFAYAHWSLAPSYVLFLGDACWDYRHYLGGTTKENYVPSWGIPAQDNLLLNVDAGDPFADFFAGRLPAETPNQATSMVQKVVSLTQTPPQGLWRKSVLFVNGGFDLDDAAQLETWSEQLIDTYVEPAPFIGNPVRIYKGNENYWPHFYNARVRAAIDSGCVVVGFMGHGATHTWDLMFENADLLLLENGDMLPFVLSPTCFTGDFGDHKTNVFGEDFLRRDDVEHGAIGFWGSSALASESDMRLINGSFMSHALTLEPWTNGEACYTARMAGGNTLAASFFNLLGDPLASVAAPDMPDLRVEAAGIQLDREEPGEGEQVRVRARLQNWGVEVADSSTVLLGTDAEEQAFSKRLGPFGLETEVALTWDTSGMLGDHVLWVRMDALDEVEELQEDNNYASRDVTVLPAAPLPCQPLDCALLKPEDVTLVVASIDSSYELQDYRFQVDTVSTFDSPWLISSGVISGGQRVTMWSPQLQDSVTCWWRSRAEGPASAGAWSIPRSFTVEQQAQGRWKQTATEQFAADSLWQSEALAGGARLLQQVDWTDVARLDQGASATASSYLSGWCAPENLLGGTVGNSFGEFYFANWDQDQWARVDLGQTRLLKRIGSAHEGEGMTNRAVWSFVSVETSLNGQTYQEWGHVGPFAAWGDSIPSEVYFEVAEAIPVRYVLLHYGQCNPQSGEGSRVYEVYAFQPEYASEGVCLSPPIGPVAAWTELAWEPEQPASTQLLLDVLGSGPDGTTWQEVPGFQGLTSSGGISLAGIDASEWPLLRLRAELGTDALELTPRLDAWQVDWDAAPDLTVEPGVSIVPLPPWPDQPCTVAAWVGNVGSDESPATSVWLSDSTEEGSELVGAADAGWLPPGFRERISFVWTPSVGAHILIVSVDPEDTVEESWEGNNRQVLSADVLADLAFVSDSLTIVPRVPVEGDTVAVSCALRNQGTVSAPSFVVGLLADAVPVDSVEVEGLSPGQTDTVSLSWDTGGWWGHIPVQVLLDAAGQVQEVQEDNNEASDTVEVLSRCDYVAAGLSVSNIAPPEGDPVLVTGVVANGGQAIGGPVRVQLAWRAGGTGDSVFAETWTDSIIGGGADTVQAWWPTIGRSGLDTLALVADPYQDVSEPDEGNNRTEAPLEVLTGVDLVVSSDSLTVVPAEPTKLDSCSISAGIRNASLLDIVQPFEVRLLLADDVIGTTMVPGLAGRSTAWLSWAWVPQASGQAVVSAVADSLGEVQETNEGNNRGSVSVTVRGWPDLVLRPEDMHFASLPLRQWDWPETVRVVVHNEGESPADSVWLELFLGDPQAQGSSIGSAVVPVMAGASQDTCWVPWATPPAEAEVFLYAFLDRADRIREENETNNLAVRKIQVLADSVAPVVWLGTEDSLSATGDYLAPGTTILGVVTDSLSAPDPTSLEVSLDGTVLDESDYNLSWQGTQRLVAALQVGEAPGTHSVRLRASDIAGNWCDPVAFAYVVSHELSLRNVYPFPSPATDWTEFTFLVSHPASATIDLFSLSGRPVRRLRAEVEPPIARLPWDLRDEDGDRVAAGVYLYVLRVFGETGAHRRHEGRVVVGGR
jgi:subtilase family serine protease